MSYAVCINCDRSYREEESCPACVRKRNEENVLRNTDSVMVPRDLHGLYKEAAERWANEQNVSQSIVRYDALTHTVESRTVQVTQSLVRVCRQCGCEWNNPPKNIHAADCKAARILNLKR